ncbi:major head protein [uncultured Mediterranean phage uvMED]|nr:major head protein [uncultured Mediterranean phage uvMED]BAQ90432.1 major head protein [uncultured Mediterranean phage uvMED]
MAKVTNAFDTYSATADREQLSDVIYNISPQATPFMSAIGKNSIKNVVFDWQTENLPTPSGAGQLEGFELARSASVATSRVSNVAQISSRDATVTGSQQASDPAGKKSEMAHQLAIMAKALKRDMETALCQKGAKTTGNATTARVTGGFESWITSNVSRGTNGAGNGGGAAPTDGTQRALTEALLKSVLQSCFSNGGEPSLAICGPVNKQKISGFTGRASARQMIDANTVEASVSIYASDFGELKIVPSNFSRERSLLLVDPDYAKVSYLRDFKTVDISTIGDAETKMIVAEYGLEMSNEAAHGIVADLTTS